MAKLRILSAADVRALLPMTDCIELMERTLVAVSAGEATIPLRQVMPLPGGHGLFGLMPGALAGAGFGIKLLSLFPDNPAHGLSSHLGLVALFESQHGQPVGLMDASQITAIRTAAVSAVATRWLAREDAGDLAILGAGEQAASHLEAMACVRKLRRVRVWSRTPAHARAFAEAGAATSGLQIEVADDAEAAVAGADLVCTVSAARSPILAGPWIAPGTHVNAVGASTPDTAEIDSDLVARARYFVDFRASTHAEAGEYLRALASGVIGPEHILGEIGEIVAGRIAGRRSADEITVFKSLGIAAEDVAVARWLLDRAQAAGVGQVADI